MTAWLSSLLLRDFVNSPEIPLHCYANDDPHESEDKSGKETPEGHYSEDEDRTYPRQGACSELPRSRPVPGVRPISVIAQKSFEVLSVQRLR